MEIFLVKNKFFIDLPSKNTYMWCNNWKNSFVLILFSIFIYGDSLGQTANRKQQFVIEMRNFSVEKTFSLVADYCKSNSKLSCIGYCESLGLLVFEIKNNNGQSIEDPSAMLKEMGIDYYFKNGATFEQVVDACNGKYKVINKKQ